MFTARTATKQIAAAFPLVAVRVLEAPPIGTAHLLYSMSLLQGDLSPRAIDLYLSDGVRKVYLVEESAKAWLTEVKYPPTGQARPVHQIAGWDLWLQTDGYSFGEVQAVVDYGEHTGIGSEPTDYKWLYATSPAVQGLFPMLANPVGSNKVYVVGHISVHNGDSGSPLGDHSFFLVKTRASVDYFFRTPANVLTPGQWESWPDEGQRIVLEPGDTLQGWMASHDQNNAPSYLGISYLEAGGVPNVQFGATAYSDVGPWERRSGAVLHAKCVEFDGASERLETWGALSQALGIADSWTVAVWAKPEGNGSNTQWVFCHGGLSNPCRIHLYRDTQDADYPWRIHIRDNDGTPNSKDYEFGEDLPLDAWYLIACTYDGTDLLCYVDGVVVTPVRINDDDTLIAMADSNRQMSIGGVSTGSDTDGFDGRVHSAASWSSVLTADELLYLFNHPGIDWREDAGDYASSADNEHYYLCGRHGTPDIGHDYGLGSNLFDLATETGIDNTNIKDDGP